MAESITVPGAESRINNIMKIDTNALLNTLKDLEDKLSSYHRADEVPTWAVSLIPRMEIMEMKTSKLEKKSNHHGGAGVQANITEIQMEGRIYDRVKQELDSQIGVTNMTMESKVGSISLEVDRLHKLLQIRPTTSELQKVVLQIQEIKKTVGNNMNELSDRVEMIVKDKVVNEMSSIIDKLHIIENSSNANMKIMMDKMELVTGDMSSLRSGVQNSLDVIKYDVEAATTSLNEQKEKMDYLKGEIDVNNERNENQFDCIASQHKQMTESITDLNVQLHTTTGKLQSTAKEHTERLDALKAYNINKQDENSRKFNEIVESVQSVTSAYTLDSEQQKAQMADLSELVKGVQEKGDETANNLEVLIKGDILTAIANIEQRQNEDKKHLVELDERLSSLNTKMSRLSKQIQTVEAAQEPLQQQITDVDNRLTGIDEETKASIDAIVKDMQKQMSDLVVVRDEAAVIKTLGHASDSRVKVIQTTMADLLSTTEAFASRFGDLNMRIEKEKIEMLKQVQESEDALKIEMCEKHAEIEGAIQNVKENLDLMVHAADHEKQVAKGKGRGKLKPGEAHKRGDGKSGITPNIAHLTPEAGSVPAVSAEEQLAVSQSHAQFIGDLCINFEEVSIRRADVPEIPPVIIENVIATTQVLTGFIAQCADAESVSHVLRADPNEITYDDIVQEKRHEKLSTFLNEVNILLVQNNKQPGQVRLEAREKFMNMLRMALDLCISKHEQVRYNVQSYYDSYFI